MPDQQIDPHKLNEVLEQILEGVQSLREGASSASPEFEILMNNYLSKANEAERNNARFEEALERLEIREQENKRLKLENGEFQKRIRGLENDFEQMRTEHLQEESSLRDKLTTTQKDKDEMEDRFKDNYSKELTQATSDLKKEADYLKERLTDLQEEKDRLEQKLTLKINEVNNVTKELNELKISLVNEQAHIRQEIIEATQRSSDLEKDFQSKKDHFVKHIKNLEVSVEELSSKLDLKQRELEYKDALLSQTFKVTKSPSNNFTSPQQHHPPQEEAATSGSSQSNENQQGFVGGIWSKLGS